MSNSYNPIPDFYFILESKNFNKNSNKKFGKTVFLLPISKASYIKELNGLSTIAIATSLWELQYLNAATAPIDRPHSPILINGLYLLRYLITDFISFV